MILNNSPLSQVKSKQVGNYLRTDIASSKILRLFLVIQNRKCVHCQFILSISLFSVVLFHLENETKKLMTYQFCAFHKRVGVS